MRAPLTLTLFAVSSMCYAQDPETKAVMYEFSYIEASMTIVHAQVIGGYPSVDACQEAMPKVMGVITPQLNEGERVQLQGSGIREVKPKGPQVST